MKISVSRLFFTLLLSIVSSEIIAKPREMVVRNDTYMTLQVGCSRDGGSFRPVDPYTQKLLDVDFGGYAPGCFSFYVKDIFKHVDVPGPTSIIDREEPDNTPTLTIREEGSPLQPKTIVVEYEGKVIGKLSEYHFKQPPDEQQRATATIFGLFLAYQLLYFLGDKIIGF